MRLGIPVALQDALVSISFLAITAIVNSLGVVVSAGVGVAERLCGFIMLAPSAFMQSLSAFVAQNVGAGQKGRAKRAMFYGMASFLCFGVVLAYLSFFHGGMLSAVFSRDSQVIAASADYLRAYAIDTLLTSIMFCSAGYFNGCTPCFLYKNFSGRRTWNPPPDAGTRRAGWSGDGDKLAVETTVGFYVIGQAHFHSTFSAK